MVASASSASVLAGMPCHSSVAPFRYAPVPVSPLKLAVWLGGITGAVAVSVITTKFPNAGSFTTLVLVTCAVTGLAWMLWMLPLLSTIKSPTFQWMPACHTFAERSTFFWSSPSPTNNSVFTPSIRAGAVVPLVSSVVFCPAVAS